MKLEEEINIDEGIGFGEDNLWTPKFNSVENPEYYTDMYMAGQTKQMLRIGEEVEWTISGGWSTRVGYISIPTWVPLGTYDITSSDIPFTPSYVNIKGYLWSWIRSWCDICMDGTTNAGIYSVWSSPRFLNNRAINLFDDATSRFQADFISFINWWIRVDVTQNNYTVAVELAIIASA